MRAVRDILPNEWTVERSPQPLEAEWRELEKHAVGTPFQHFDWVRLYHKLHPADAVFVAGRRNGMIEIVLPLTLRSGVLGWFGETLNNYNAPLVSQDLFAALTDDDSETIWRDVRLALGGVKASILRRQPAMLGGRCNPFAQWRSVVEPTHAHALTLGTKWPDFFEKMFSASTRKSFRKKENWLSRDGELAVRCVQGSSEAYGLAQLLLQWKADQVAAHGGRNNFADENNREMIARFAADHPDLVRLYVMTVGGAPVALGYHIGAGREAIIYQIAYAPGPAARFSPGRLLINHMIRLAIGEGRSCLDFAVGDDAYKLAICDRKMDLTTSFAAHAPAGWPRVAIARAKLAAKAAIKSNPGLLDAVLRVHAFAGKLTARR